MSDLSVHVQQVKAGLDARIQKVKSDLEDVKRRLGALEDLMSKFATTADCIVTEAEQSANNR